MLKHLICTFFIIFSMQEALALEYYNFLYKVEADDSFSFILKRFVKDGSIINAKTPLVKKIMAKNPKVKNWNKLVPGTILELYISSDFMDLEKYGPYEEDALKRLAEEEERKKLPAYPVGNKGSVFYMSSLGIFNQKADNVAEINFKQNSPVSLGLAFTYYPKDKLYSFSYSAYFSYLIASANSLTKETVEIPPEIGANFYGEYRIQKYNFTGYFGPDFEKSSAFNLQGLQNDKKIYVDNMSVIYLTAGIAKAFTLLNQQFFTKISLSKSFTSTYSNNAPKSEIDASDFKDTGKYGGMKFMFYLNYKFNNRLYLHSLLKYHQMSGPSEMSTLRMGVGFGYILF